jgi:hypothetical protein
MASILRTVSMIAEFGQQQWSYTNFRGSDRTLRSRDRILDFSQKMVKTSAGAENLTSAKVLTSRAGTTGRYSTGETPPIKAEWPVPSDHLRSTWTRGNTIYEDLNESTSARASNAARTTAALARRGEMAKKVGQLGWSLAIEKDTDGLIEQLETDSNKHKVLVFHCIDNGSFFSMKKTGGV